MRYRIGLDLGITSVGWSVIENNNLGNPIRIVNLGSRIFDAAENPKNGYSVPKNGSIRVLTITEKQYENVEILLGKKSKNDKPLEYETLSFF